MTLYFNGDDVIMISVCRSLWVNKMNIISYWNMPRYSATLKTYIRVNGIKYKETPPQDTVLKTILLITKWTT